MSTLPDSLLAVEKELAKENGPFSLFALFLREDAPNKWDLVVSAPWTERDKGAALRVISDKMTSLLDPTDLLAISRIALVEPDNPAVETINRAFKVEHGSVEVKDSSFFGMAIKHAHIFASTRVASAVPPQPPAEKTNRRTRRKAAHG